MDVIELLAGVAINLKFLPSKRNVRGSTIGWGGGSLINNSGRLSSNKGSEGGASGAIPLRLVVLGLGR